MDDELRALAKVVDRLVERFPTMQRASVERVVREEHRALDGRPVRDYVPILVERGARTRLRNDQAGSPPVDPIARPYRAVPA